MANQILLQRIADEVEKLISENPVAVERFKEQLKIFNEAWRRYYGTKKNEPQPYEDPTGQNQKDGYEYDPDFKMWFPKDTPPLPPDPTKWQLADKLPCYYGTLAVIYDSVKGSVAPFELCEGILDNLAFGFMQLCISRAWGFDKGMLDTALRWVKADLAAGKSVEPERNATAAKKEKGNVNVNIFGDVQAGNLQIAQDASIHEQPIAEEKKKGIVGKILEIISTIITFITKILWPK